MVCCSGLNWDDLIRHVAMGRQGTVERGVLHWLGVVKSGRLHWDGEDQRSEAWCVALEGVEPGWFVALTGTGRDGFVALGRPVAGGGGVLHWQGLRETGRNWCVAMDWEEPPRQSPGGQSTMQPQSWSYPCRACLLRPPSARSSDVLIL